MKSFEAGFLEKHPVPHELVRTIRLIGEYRGKEALFRQQAPQVLKTLMDGAIVQSTESSNRLEGIEAPRERVRELVDRRDRPRNRSEQEIAGYRDVLATIHANHANIPFTLGVVLQFHRDLYRFTPQTGGRWKSADNEIVEIRADGTRIVRFTPVPAHVAPEAMERLHAGFQAYRDRGEVDPLLLIPAYVLDFSCIHPFSNANGRMARLLTVLLLYRAGYEVARYVSLEGLVEQHREGYYDALLRSSQGWHEGRHSLLPWWEYFLGVMLLGAYREFERRVGELGCRRGAKTEMVLSAIEKLPRQFRYADLARACPGVSRPTIKGVVSRMRREGRVECVKPGRDAVWEKKD